MLNYKQQSIADDVDHGDIDEDIWNYLEGKFTISKSILI